MTSKLTVRLIGASDRGKVRGNNEDFFILDERLGVAVVADGMGGHAAGEVASRVATESIIAQSRVVGALDGAPEETLRHWIEEANREIVGLNAKTPQRSNMGTTIVVALVREQTLSVAHVGDSRAYLFRVGELTRLTRDHSVVEEQISHGLITPENAEKSPFANVLTRALGSQPEVAVDVCRRELCSGDVMLLATDGLTRMLPDSRIAQELGEGTTPEESIRRLINAANEAGGADNVTVVLALCR